MNTPRITLVIPFFNEAEYLPETLASIAAQTDRCFKLILVNNASTDGSAHVAQEACAKIKDIEVVHLQEAKPGKIFALIAGIAEVDTELVATLDADTVYPKDYVARMTALFEIAAENVAVLAFGLIGEGHSNNTKAGVLHSLYANRLPRKCHTGGFGQAFRTKELREVGGFDPAVWPYVLEDHEIVHRIGKLGALAYSDEHVCYPSDRREENRSDCSWTLSERVMYKAMPSFAMDWFFYKFLASRFERRGLNNVKLRRKIWEEAAN